MFDSLVENEVPSVYASAHGGHSSLDSKGSYVSSKAHGTKAINKILAKSLSGQDSSSFNDLVKEERIRAKERIELIKSRGKENLNLFDLPTQVQQQLQPLPTTPVQPPQLPSDQSSHPVQTSGAQAQQSWIPPGHVQSAPSHTGQALTPLSPYHTGHPQTSLSPFQAANPQSSLYPYQAGLPQTPLSTYQHHAGHPQTSLSPFQAGNPQSSLFPYQASLPQTPLSIYQGGQPQTPVSPFQPAQVQSQIQLSPVQTCQAQNPFPPFQVNQAQIQLPTFQPTAHVQTQLHPMHVGHVGNSHPSFQLGQQTPTQYPSLQFGHFHPNQLGPYLAPHISGLPQQPRVDSCPPFSFGPSVFDGRTLGNLQDGYGGGLRPQLPTGYGGPQFPAGYGGQMLPVGSNSFGTPQSPTNFGPTQPPHNIGGVQIYPAYNPAQFSPPINQLMSNTVPSAAVPTTAQSNPIQYLAGTHQPLSLLRTSVQQIEGDNMGNYRLSKNESAVTYDGMPGP